jgi:hypothetical protein
MNIHTNFARGAALLASAIIVATVSHGSMASPQEEGATISGTWVIAVATDPFGIPGGTLPGMATIHRDGTLIGSDAGDVGSSPFTITDTPQHGSWIRTGPQSFEMVTLFLRKDEISGEIEGWHRIRFALRFEGDHDHMIGQATEEVLPCEPADPTPFRLFNCADPTTGTFAPAPFAIPIRWTRLQVR